MNNTDAQNKAIHAGAKTKALKGKERTSESHRMGKLLMDSGFTPKIYKDNKGEKFKGWSKEK